MKKTAMLVALVLVGCDASSSKTMTYEQLVAYPVQCNLANQQLAELKALQRAKNFDQDPDNLSDTDRNYNARLKATIWWYAYKCGDNT
jgi:uncharacterized protein YcfL